jgi:hypothetical protein
MTMRPIDYRNETWESIKRRIAGDRMRVYDAWTKHGPCTTEELFARSGIRILSLRPRTTELMQLGLVELVPVDRCAGIGGRIDRHKAAGGVYRAVSITQAELSFNDLKRRARSGEQMFLKL